MIEKYSIGLLRLEENAASGVTVSTARLTGQPELVQVAEKGLVR